MALLALSLQEFVNSEGFLSVNTFIDARGPERNGLTANVQPDSKLSFIRRKLKHTACTTHCTGTRAVFKARMLAISTLLDSPCLECSFQKQQLIGMASCSPTPPSHLAGRGAGTGCSGGICARAAKTATSNARTDESAHLLVQRIQRTN